MKKFLKSFWLYLVYLFYVFIAVGLCNSLIGLIKIIHTTEVDRIKHEIIILIASVMVTGIVWIITEAYKAHNIWRKK